MAGAAARLWRLCWLAVMLLVVVGANHDTLRVTQVVFRHGDRAPIKTFPTDPNQEDAWPQGFEQLTMKGIDQEHKLGQRLRTHYNGWLNDTYINKEILVSSTDYDRTLMSAELVLAGLYPPLPSQQWNPELSWQPIPVHTRPKEDDNVLYVENPCDRYTELDDSVYGSDEVKTYLEDNKSFLDYITLMSGQKDLNPDLMDLMHSIPEPLFCAKENGLPLPLWVTDDIYEQTQYMSLLKTRLRFKLPEEKKLRGGRWIYEALAVMTNITLNTGLYTQKIFMYGAHDSSITVFLSLLGVWDQEIPPYSCFFMLELHEPTRGHYTVKLFYKNDTNTNYEADPRQLFFPDCPEPCSLESFEEMIEPYIVTSDTELAKLCADTTAKKNKKVHATTLAVMVIVIIVAIILVTGAVLCARKRSQNPYQSVESTVYETR